LQEGHIGADFFHVFADVEEDGDGTKSAHDAADAKRIRDGLFDAVFLWNFKIDDGAGFVAADLKHADGIVRAIEGGMTVERSFNLWLCAEELRDLVRHDLGRFEADGVNVHQTDGGVGKLGEGENVCEQVLGEDGAACADEGDFGHGVLLIIFRVKFLCVGSTITFDYHGAPHRSISPANQA